jgi:hypothetical protein
LGWAGGEKDEEAEKVEEGGVLEWKEDGDWSVKVGELGDLMVLLLLVDWLVRGVYESCL